jgi:ABC-type transport system involved in cytochrome bd biosynthesis fused ATPase/permease subunit
MSAVKYILAVASIFLLGTAAGAFAHHPKDGSGYTIPIVLAICGIVAAVAAWKSDELVRRFARSSDGKNAGDDNSH